MLGRQIMNFSKTNKKEVNPMKSPIRGLILTLMTFALLLSVGCDYASVTAPEPIEAQSTVDASPANDINSEYGTLSKKGGKKGSSDDDGSEDDGSVSQGNRGNTRYGWAF